MQGSMPWAPHLASLLARLDQRQRELLTVAVHAGENHRPAGPWTGADAATEPPLVLASAFAFASADEAARAFTGEGDAYIYGRWGNPTVEALEAKVAALEGTEDACAAASGMAAIAGVLLTLTGSPAGVATSASGGSRSHGHVVAPRAMYAESARLLRERLPRFGIETTFVEAAGTGPGTGVAAYEAALRPDTRVLYLETPANPTLAITDIAGVVALAQARGIVTVADNTFATPFCQTPAALGVDLVVHSMTKALGGHGDAIGGVVCGRRDLVGPIRELLVKGLGSALSPFNAFLITRGLRTLPLRQRQMTATASRLASELSSHPAVTVVHHPSLPSHPGHALAAAQMHGPGSVLSFEVRAGAGPTASALARGRRLLDSVEVITHAVSLGDARSLLVHPASTTHSTMPAEARRSAGIGDGLLRLSVGLEDFTDLSADLRRTLDTFAG